MATAQQLFVDQFVKAINADPNLAARVIASSPSTGLLRVTTRTTSDPRANYLLGGSSVTGAGTFASRPVTGSPKYAELFFSWTLAPGDTVKINAGDNFQSLDLTYNLPLGTTVDAGGLDHTTIGGGGGGGSGGVAVGGSGIASAQHRRLVVMECGSASSSFGSLFALDPQDATGISIPTFRVVTSLPSAGSSMGESVYVTATRQGYVWDGTAWRDITASPIRSFPNDALLQANTTEQVGTYAVASDTGNMYVRTAVDGWRRIGIAEFSTYSDLNAWDAAIGTEAISRDLDVLFLRVTEGGAEKWLPVSQLVKTEAEIIAVPNIGGLTAVASDTGKRFVNNGTRWVQDPIEHYATETALLAATAIDGHLAWADDTNVVFTASGGTWHRLQGPQITVGITAPSSPGTGDQWFDQREKQNLMKVWDGKAWKETSGASVGTTGAMVKLPGYFNEDPSLTATSDDEGGLAFKYYGSQKQLWLYKNGPGWGAITPMMGDPANAGRPAVADANGFATWGQRQGLVHVANIGGATYNTEAVNIIGSTNFTFKAGRYYRVTGHVKVHIDNNAWTHLRVEVTNAGNCRQVHTISGEDRFDEADHFLPAVGEVFSLTADATRKLELKVTNRRSITLYYSWNGGSQISVEDLGPV